jgi:hypothetical protein
MELKNRVSAFARLGTFLNDVLNDKVGAGAYDNKLIDLSKELSALFAEVHIYNGWFTKQNVISAVKGIADMLDEKSLENWVSKYPFLQKSTDAKQVGVIMAGNIPMVGFHDLLCILISGNRIVARLSSDDNKLLPLVVRALVFIEPRFESFIYFADGKIEKIDAMIATGSNNSSRYFEYYFSKYPHIIRKNRNSVAVLEGNESPEQIAELGKDIFQYYGLGCRNVSKLMIPRDYVIDRFYEGIYSYSYVMDNKKYANNYEYNRTVYLMNSVKGLLDNNFLMLKEDIGIASPVGVLYYERYVDKDTLKLKLKADSQSIQCVVSQDPSIYKPVINFGYTQCPTVLDYADGVDVMEFLGKL